MILTLKIATKYFLMTLHLRTMHHHTKFAYMRLCDSEDVSWTKPGHMDRWKGQTDVVTPVYGNEGQ